MFADFKFYRDEFGGIKIADETEYKYLANFASRYILKYTDEIDVNSKMCECAIAEYLQRSFKQGNITSETIPNYYSVSFGSNDNKTLISEINAILELYLGSKYSSVGIVKILN